MPERADTPLPKDTERLVAPLMHFPFIEAVYLYGSRARGDADEYSDYDLAILCPRATGEEWARVGELLDKLPLLNKIEYVRYDTLEDGLFKQQIDDYKRVLYARH